MLLRNLDEIATVGLTRPSVIIGNFDGVHLGHRALIDAARARDVDASVVVLTFDPHPVQYFRRDESPFLLSTIKERSVALHEAGADHVVALRFDDALANTTADDFVNDILVGALDVATVFVGEHFVFGKGRTGNFNVLQALGERLGFDAVAIELVVWEDERASSTRIRDAIRAGDVERAAALLGRPYRVTGPVVHGEKRGRELGFPTANVATSSDRLLPPAGIYATEVEVEGLEGRWMGASYIGNKPTFPGDDLVLETFVLDAPEPFDLYDREMSVDFVAKIRGDVAFDSAQALVEQMHRDVDAIRKTLGAHQS